MGIGVGLLALVALAAALLVRSDAAWRLAMRVEQRWMAAGPLSVLGPEGWREVSREDALRREWTAADAFLVGDVSWRALADGFEWGELVLRRSPNPALVRVVLARLDPTRWRFRVLAGEGWPATDVASLAEAAGVPFAVNGPFFSEDGPLGLVVVDGVVYNRQVRHKAAHFLVDGPGVSPRIVSRKGADWAGVEQGFQGFPAVMEGGHTFSYMRFGGRGFRVLQVERRTAACVDGEGRVLFLVTDTLRNGLSLYELATVLGGLGCRDAMGFDGGSSTGLTLNLGGVEAQVRSLRPVPVALGAAPLAPAPEGPSAREVDGD